MSRQFLFLVDALWGFGCCEFVYKLTFGALGSYVCKTMYWYCNLVSTFFVLTGKAMLVCLLNGEVGILQILEFVNYVSMIGATL